MRENKKKLCPLCGSSQNFQCYKEKILDIDYSEGNFKTNINQYLICEICGLIYLYPRPFANDLQKYYSSIPVSQISNSVLNEYKKPEYERTVNFILSNICLDNGNIIDVGAATGDLLRRFEHCKNVHLKGIEASKDCCDFAKKHYGIEMINEQLEDIDLVECGLLESADLVLCCHTLEHIIDPANFLHKLNSIIKPSGFLYIEVPSTRILSTFSNPRYGRNIHHLHLNHFLASNLSSACEKIGLFPIIMLDDIGTNYPSLKAIFGKQNPADMANNLFLQQVDVHTDLYKRAIDISIAILDGSNKKIVLWGAGQDLFYVLRDNPKIFPSDRVTLVDRNPHKQGKDFWGLKVINPKEIDWNQISHIIITPSSQMLQLHIKEDIDQMGLSSIKYSLMFPVKNPKV